MSFPKVKIGDYEVSRLVCGTNPFFGFSHFSAARDAWQKRYFTQERIVEVMVKCTELGINGIVGPAEPRLAEAIKEHDRQTGRHIIWISTTYGISDFAEQEREIRWLGEQKAEICLIHPGYTDTHLITAENQIKDIDKLLKLIRDCGMLPGISTHRPEGIIVCDRAGYDVTCYILPINVIGFLSSVETSWVSSIIKGTEKPVVAIKPLAAGRLMPFEGLNYVYNSIKPQDIVAIGLMSPEEAEEDVKIARSIITGIEEKVELLETPSKSTVK